MVLSQDGYRDETEVAVSVVSVKWFCSTLVLVNCSAPAATNKAWMWLMLKAAYIRTRSHQKEPHRWKRSRHVLVS